MSETMNQIYQNKILLRMKSLKLQFFLIFLKISSSISEADLSCSEDMPKIYKMDETEEVRPVPYYGNKKDFKAFKIIDEFSGKLQVQMKQRVNTNLEVQSLADGIKLEILLLVSNPLNLTTCKNATNYVEHSEKTIIVKGITSPCGNKTICDVVIPVYFNYVYTGCYKINVFKKERYERSNGLQLGPKLLETKYEKHPLNKMSATVSPQMLSHGDDNMFTLTFFFNYETSDQMGHITNRTLLKELKPRVMDLRVTNVYNHSNSMSCLVNNNVKENNACDDCKLLEESSSKHDYIVACYGFHFAPGNYCVRIRFIDDRCTISWMETYDENQKIIPCTWYFTTWIGLDSTGSESSDFIRMKADSTDFYSYGIPALIFIALIFLLMCLYYLFILCSRPVKSDPEFHKKDRNSNEQNFDTVNFKITKEVLLLYPRDCPSLMESMKILRKILKIGNCKVYDCFDDSLYKEIASNSNAWIKSLIVDKSVQVIVVASDCSRLLEGKLLKKENISYKSPECLDDLFLTGLNYLQSSVNNLSGKISVISLQERNEDGKIEGLKYLNLPQIYWLPFQLEELILSLHNCYGSYYITGLKESTEVRQFQNAVEDYRNYMKNNKGYLHTLFDVKQ